ncbi:unnamed protein product, partial [Mesorhabditis belari]|uniref:F-box domain-containing protein n=1 Tax=Mesorhabditis belari TaxID=2138241 RepID=A0AAF3EZW4_9BILA
MRHLSELFQKDFLAQLPEEIAYRILAYLTPCDLMTCAGVSRAWRRLCEDDRTWRQKCIESGYLEFDAPSFRFLGGRATNRANKQTGITICSHMDVQEAQQNRQAREIAYGECYERSPWKSLYLRKKRIISNWRSRAIQSSTVLENGQPSSYQVSEDGKYIVCGGQDETGHTDWITCMSLHGTTLVSGSLDETLRVWDIVDGKCLHILAVDARNCVQFDGERVVSSGGLECTHGECLHMLTGHTDITLSLLFESQRDLVVSGSRDGRIRVWDVQRGTCITHLDFLQGFRFEDYRNFRMQLRGNTLVSCYDSDIWVWDIREGGSCLHHLHGRNGHTSNITSLQLLDSGLLVTGSIDGSVKLWDVDKGKFVRDLIRLQYQNCILDLKATETLLVCAVGLVERYGPWATKLVWIDFDASYP